VVSPANLPTTRTDDRECFKPGGLGAGCGTTRGRERKLGLDLGARPRWWPADGDRLGGVIRPAGIDWCGPNRGTGCLEPWLGPDSESIRRGSPMAPTVAVASTLLLSPPAGGGADPRPIYTEVKNTT